MVPACGRGRVRGSRAASSTCPTRLPDDPQRLAPVEFEADAVDGANFADVPAEHHTLGQPVGLHQVTYPHHDFVGRRGAHRCGAVRSKPRRCRPRCGRRPPRCGCTRRVWLSATVTNAGSSARHASMTSGQRGANGQPGSRPASDGGAPGIGTSRAALRRVQVGHRAQQPCGVGHSAIPVERCHRCRLDRPTRVHHQRAVGELGHHAEVVGDDQHAGAGDVTGGPEHIEDLRLHGDVQRGGGLVADQQIGVVGDGHRDDHPLAFAAGQFMRERLGAPLRLRDADEFEQLDRAAARRAPVDPRLVHRDGLGDLVADGVDRRQRRHRVLEHRADRRAPDPRHVVVGHAEQFVAVQPNRAGDIGVLGQQADHRHRGGRLPRAGFADHRDHLAGVDAQADPAHGVDGGWLRWGR